MAMKGEKNIDKNGNERENNLNKNGNERGKQYR